MKNESGLKKEKIERCFGLSPDIIIPYYFSVVSSWPGVHLRPAVSAGLGLGTRVSNGKVRTQEHSPGEPVRAGYFYSNVSNSQFLNINEKEEKMNVKY